MRSNTYAPRRLPEISAGDLRNKITIRRDVGSQSTSGQLISNFTGTGSLVCTVWAQVVADQSGEQPRAQIINSQVTTVLKIRYRSDITASMRVEHAGRILNIVGVRDVTGRKMSLHLDCKEWARG